MHQRAKFHQNLSIRCGDIAIFRFFFKMAAFCHLGFVRGICALHKVAEYSVVYVTLQNLLMMNAIVLIT